MSSLVGGGTQRVQQTQPTPATAMRVQTSAQGTSISLIGGKVRVPGNLIDYDDFTAIAHNSGGSSSGGGGKGGGNSGCFAPEVIVSGPTGGIAIGEIRPGDPVWCIDPATGERVAGEVQQVLVHDVAQSGDRMLRFHHAGGSLHVTTNHYLWDAAWPDSKREAITYRPGDALTHETLGQVTIAAITPAPDILRTYNLVILPHHNFFADGILAHNGGGGGSGKGSTSYTYTAALAFGLAEGPITAINTVWQGGTPYSLANDNFVAFLGGQGQAPWGYLTTNHPNKALGYSNLAYVAAGPFSLGSDSSLPSLTFEVVGGIANAVTESWTVASPYTYQATNWTLADSVTEQATVPGTAPTVVTAVNPTAANCAAVMMGTITGTIAGTASCGVFYMGGAALTAVSGSPSQGQYAVDTSGEYTFSAEDAGAAIIIVDLALSPGVYYASGASAGTALTQVLSGPGQGQFSVSAAGLYTFAAADAGAELTIVDVADADPSAWVADVLTNPRYGAGFPVANLGGLAQLKAYAYAQGLFVSPALSASTAFNSFLTDFCAGLNGEFVWSAGLLDWVPYGDAPVSGNGYSWSPPAEPIYSLDDDDFMKNAGTASVGVSSYTSQDPIVGAVKRQADCYNDVKVEYLDRGNNYNAAITESYDGAEIAVHGRRSADTKSLHFFCFEQAAWVSCQLQLGRQGIRNEYTFTVPWFYILLDPMDIIAISDAAMGLSSQWVRILEITENQEDQSLTITAEEYLEGTGTAPEYGGSRSTKAGFAQNYNVDPGNANPPIIFEPPYALTGDLEIWLATSGGPNWAGAQVWTSTDGDTYARVASVANPSRMGVLTADLPPGGDPDTADSVVVNLSESRGQLSSGTQSDADAGNTACWVANDGVGGEIISYETATLNSAYNYTLGTYLRRGLYGSPVADHASGSAFVRLDGAICKIPYNTSQVGLTLYVKLVSYNQWGDALQDISTVPVYTHTIAGAPLLPSPTNLELEAGSAQALITQSGTIVSQIQVTWTDPASTLFDRILVQYQQQGAATWQVAPPVPAGVQQALITPVADGVTYVVEIAATDAAGNTSAWVSSAVVVTGQSGFAVSPVTGLELVGQGNNTTFTGENAAFDWRWTSTTGSFEIGDEPNGADTGWTDPWVLGFAVNIYDSTTGQKIRSEPTRKEATYTYTFNDNLTDAALYPPASGDVARRSFTIGVAVVDLYGRPQDEQRLTVDNPAPAVPTAIDITPGLSTIFARFVPDPSQDVAGTIVWMTTNPTGWSPLPGDATQVYAGPNTFVSIPATSGTAYYVCLASYDSFGKTGLNTSSQIEVTAAYLAGAQIAAGIISSSMLVSTLQTALGSSSVSGSLANQIATTNTALASANSTISSLSTTVAGNSSSITTLTGASSTMAGQIITLNSQMGTANSNLTTLNSTTATQATSITSLNTTVAGNSASIAFQASTISGLEAQYYIKTDVNGYVSGFGISSTGATSQFIIEANDFLVITPGATAMTPFMVSAGEVYINGAQIGAATIGTAAIETAAITTALIANLAVTSAQIANSTITSAQIASATITAAQIASGTITNAQIANATITNAQIASGTIQAANIASATITNAQIASGTITSANIGTASVQTLNIGANQVTIPTSVANNTSVTLSSTAATILSKSLTTTGAPLAITFGFRLTVSDTYVSPGYQNTVTANIYRNGTLIGGPLVLMNPYPTVFGQSSVAVVFAYLIDQSLVSSIVDYSAPTAGTYTYTVTVSSTYGGAAQSSWCNFLETLR